MHHIIVSLALFGSAVLAQEMTLPACGETCFAAGVEGSGCADTSDLECLCDTAPFNIGLVNCVAEGCGDEDITASLDTYETTCNDIGVPINMVGEEPEDPTK